MKALKKKRKRKGSLLIHCISRVLFSGLFGCEIIGGLSFIVTPKSLWSMVIYQLHSFISLNPSAFVSQGNQRCLKVQTKKKNPRISGIFGLADPAGGEIGKDSESKAELRGL